MIELRNEPDLTYIASLVRVRAAAGVLFRDEGGRVLVVHPTYKDAWEIPGGALEPDESPMQACQREVKEELGISPPVGELLCVDWVAPQFPWDGGLMFVFDGGTLTADQIADVRLCPEELAAFEFVPPRQLDQRLAPRVARRVSVCLEQGVAGGLYLEEGALTRS